MDNYANNTPKISILALTYNHENYIAQAIESILSQSETDFELIIVDDNSKDNTLKKAQQFEDKRIKLIHNKYNMGINTSTNIAFKASSGKYITLVSCDDICEKDFLKIASKYLDEHKDIGTVYSNFSYIDEKDLPRKDLNMRSAVVKNCDRIERLHHNFMIGNMVGSPGTMTRRDIFEKTYPRPYAVVNYQDYQDNIEFALESDVHILQDKLIRYRQPYNATNISAGSFYTKLREELEEDVLMDTFLQIKDIDLLNQIFSKEITELNLKIYPQTIQYCLGRFALLSEIPTRKRWGYRTIQKFLNEKENFKILRDLYNFEYKDLLSLVKYFDSDASSSIYKKYLKYKKLFNVIFISNIGLIILLFIISVVCYLLFQTQGGLNG